MDISILVFLGLGSIVILLESAILWATTKLLKFKESNFKKSIQVVGTLWFTLIILFITAVIGFKVFIPTQDIFIPEVLAFISSPFVFAFLLRKTFKENWTNTMLTIWICLGLYAIIFIVLTELPSSQGGEHPLLTGCTGFSQISPTDWKVSSRDGNIISLVLLNNAGTRVTLNAVNVTNDEKTCPYPVNSEMSAGQSLTITIPKKGECTNITLPNKGEYYRADITFDYTNIESNKTHISAGECHGQVG